MLLNNLIPKEEGFTVREGSAVIFDGSSYGDFRGSAVHLGRTVLLVGDAVVAVTGSTYTVLGFTANATGDGGFFTFGGDLYVLDGQNVYAVGDTAITSVTPYAPLYGENWSPEYMGVVKEDFSAMTDTVRVHYLNPSGRSTFTLPFYPTAFLGAYGDGVTITTGSIAGRNVTVPGSGSLSSVEIALRVNALTPESTKVKSCTRGRSLPFDSGERVCFYGRTADRRDYYVTQPVEDDALVRCRVLFSTATPLYVPRENAYRYDSPLTSVYPYRNIALLFGEKSVSKWDGGSVKRLFDGLGVADEDKVSPTSDGFLVVDKDVLVTLTAPVSHPDWMKKTEVALLPDDVVNPRLFRHPKRDAWWIQNGTSGILIWRADEKAHEIRYQLTLDRLFPMAQGMGYVRNGRICRFDDTLHTDDGNAIVWSYVEPRETDPFERAPRRNGRVTVYAVGACDVTATYTTEVGSFLSAFTSTETGVTARLLFHTGRHKRRRLILFGSSRTAFTLSAVKKQK